ncbi:hypothetical protein [Methanogenium cariaci]|uniref:hypothetical protein n=1 Tax=Methanogenium cariaci TaxID=2197 RepID=UPI00155DD71F|nr:hypothetical protein [Methanogenium cariaci]
MALESVGAPGTTAALALLNDQGGKKSGEVQARPDQVTPPGDRRRDVTDVAKNNDTAR